MGEPGSEHEREVVKKEKNQRAVPSPQPRRKGRVRMEGAIEKCRRMKHGKFRAGV